MTLRRILSSSWFLFLSLVSAAAHGGYYPGPVQPDPPPPPPPAAVPGGSTPPAPGTGSPSGPARPLAPVTPGASAPGALAGSGLSSPLTRGGGAIDPDLSAWNFWWDLNKAPYLELKRHVRRVELTSGTDGWLLGEHERPRATTLQPTEEQVRESIVPALLKVLEEEHDHDLVSGALIALGKIGNDGSGEEFRRFEAAALRLLKDDNQEIRETAAVSLGILASPRSISTLANLLWDTKAGRELIAEHEVDYRTRSFAAYGLGLIGARTPSEADRHVIVAALSRALERDRTATPDLAVACLLGLSIVPLATLGPDEPDAKRDGPAELPESSRQAQLAYLLALLEERECDVRVRAQCPVALARLVAGLPADRSEPLRQRVAGELVERLERNRDLPELLQSCTLALGELGTNEVNSTLDTRIRGALARAYSEASESQSRGFVLIAMARVGGRPGAAPRAGNGGLEQASEFLLGQLLAGKSMLRPWAALGCGVLGHELVRSGSGAAAPALERLRRGVRTVLEDEKDPSKLGACAIAAGLLRDRESAPLLLAALARTLPDEARGHVATGLALLGHDEAREPVRRIIAESIYRPGLLRESAIALGVLEDEEVAPLLVRMLLEASSVTSQTTLSTALGQVGDRRSGEPLLQTLVDRERSERARGYAAVALGNLADKENLPWNSKLALGLNYRAATSTLTDPVRGGGILDIH